MTEYLINSAALLLLLLSAQIGMKSGATCALTWMLGSVLSLFVAMRCWFLLTRYAVEYGTVSLPIMASLCFCVPFLVILLLFTKLRRKHLELFESVAPSHIGRAFGGLFGIVSGTAIVMAVVMTASILAPEYFPSDKPTILPVAIDGMPTIAFRFIEKAAGVGEDDPSHTPLPRVRNAEEKPAVFWQ